MLFCITASNYEGGEMNEWLIKDLIYFKNLGFKIDVCDINGNPGQTSDSNDRGYGTPKCYRSYCKGLNYILTNFNIDFKGRFCIVCVKYSLALSLFFGLSSFHAYGAFLHSRYCSEVFSCFCENRIKYRHMLVPYFQICASFSVLLWCLCCTQYFYSFFNLIRKYQLFRVSIDCLMQFFVFLATQRLHHVVSTVS